MRFDYSYDGAMRSLEQSALRLGVDHIDIVLIHDVDVWTHGAALIEQRFGEAMDGAYRALEKLRAAGAVRAIGVGVNEADMCERFARAGDFDTMLLAGRYSLLEQPALASFMPLALEKGIGLMLGGVFNSGILATGPVPGARYNYNPAPPEILARVAAIEAVCTRHGVPLRRAALQFPLGHEAVASLVMGAVSPAEVADQIAELSQPVPAALWAELKADGLLAADVPIARGDYGWLTPALGPIHRDFTPDDLAPLLARHGIDRTILVQAAPTVAETEYMLGIADAVPWVLGVVGWADFETPADLAQMKRLAGHPKFKGVRPMIQDLPDDGWMLRDDVQWAFRALCDLGLRFDALGFPRHLGNFLTILKRYPTLPVVVDHCMKPQIREKSDAHFRLWADGMARVADETAAVVKFSALITEADADWTVEDLRPYVDHVFRVFGPERVMWGSDWPVCRLRGEYADWRAAALSLTEGLDDVDRALIYGGTAAGFYGI
eukprot:gene39367-51883_t